MAFNLGWKLAAAIEGRSAPTILRTYSAERQAIARELIDFDRDWARMLSAPGKKGGPAVDAGEVERYFVRHGRYTAGTGTRYVPSLLIGEATHQALAPGFAIGTRFHSAPVIRLADAKPMQLGHAGGADGRWRLYAFAGREDPTPPGSAIARLCAFLADAPRSPVRRHTPGGADPDAVIDLRAVFQQPHRTLDIGAMPALLLPAKGRLGLRDYEKMFCVDPQAGDIYNLRGVDRASGCVVVVRPDQYVAHILPLDGYDQLADFFARFLLSRAG